MTVSRPPRQPIRLSEIARAVGGRVVGSGDPDISGVASLEQAGEGDLVHVNGARHAKSAGASGASAFLVEQPLREIEGPQLVVANPRYTFIQVVERFFAPPFRPRGIAREVTRGADVEIGPDVSIWPFVTLGNRARIGARATLFPGVFVGDEASIGDDCVLYPHVTLGAGCAIGQRVIVHSGTVIGSDGFGYVQHDGRHHKIPQLGSVVIEDDVELGANVTVDRATFGRTVVGRGSKVDNLVQIAHNVTIGEHTILVAQVGIAGSTRLGAGVMVGGQAGLSDHIQVGDRAMIAARSGVARDVPPGSVVSGSPAFVHELSVRAHALFPTLPELRRQIRELEKRVRALEARAVAKPKRRRT